ncbi:GNAT family N-acetyltransferase [Bacillus sp. HMF5848]|uniref:GNAT family N-acetyltransferase n=1 Tax=Bacillus sp. HMF5848 TaxID=2495421 RepID=UPI000F782239|nr:GNAT family N-acetyltransferase [Bacillus sp. HMF5848]RSK27548.1 GNAT family N-acetyltransferase [Bacillus sp. HMF5848]
MIFELEQCTITEVSNMMEEYIQSLHSPFDSFLEEHIVNSTFHKIFVGEEVAGYYAIFNNTLLTQFYLKVPFYTKSQDIMTCIFSNHVISSVFVYTADEFFLSNVIDRDYKINKQAYFFKDSKIMIPSEKLNHEGHLRQAVLSDVHKIVEVSEDFFDRLEERIKDGQIFVFMKENILLGIGIIEISELQKGYASVGMYTNEAYRKQGVGRTIIQRLKEWCYQHDLEPICGCWYYNTNSKLTLQSAGMISKTRLLNVEVPKIEDEK